MKSLLLLAFILPGSLSFCQINFEEIPIPSDFNMESVRQSPGGEYFVQATNDEESIYTSLDGVVWTKESLPAENRLNEIQFFSDDTPLLQGDIQEHLIRRNGKWYTMDIPGDFGALEVSYIKDDTLFANKGKTFSYSLDKGQTFTILFAYTENLPEQLPHLWKWENHFLLYQSVGATGYLNVFSQHGEMLFSSTLAYGSFGFVYNNCGEVVVYTYGSDNHYYLFKEPELTIEEGYATDLYPDFKFDTKIFSQEGRYYLWDKNTLYRTTGCNFEWEELAMNDLIDSSGYVWIDPNENIFLYDKGSNYFIKEETGTTSWIRHYPEINYSRVINVGESIDNDQFVLTSNFLFHKNYNTPIWEVTDSVYGLNNNNIQNQIQYSPDGDMYINRGSYLQYSEDNGATFTNIALPQNSGPEELNYMHVLGNEVIFKSNRYSSKCYYTLNNGQNWILAGVSFPLTTPFIKLVDNYMLTVDFQDNSASKINIATNEFVTEEIGISYDLNISAAFLDDGTLYLHTSNIYSENESLYSYRFGEGLKFLGHFNELQNIFYMAGIGHDLYAFSFNSYYVFDGETVNKYGYSGLPESHTGLNFTLSENDENVYAILDHNRIFRSSKLTVSSKEPAALIDFKIYPNPANTYISVSEGDVNRFDSYEIVDMLGCRKAQSNAFTGQPIDVSLLAPGMYTIVLKKKEDIIGILKFIKQ